MIQSPYQTNKVGLLPWRVNAQGEREYLVHLARPKEDSKRPGFADSGLPLAEEAALMQWGLARGTVQRAQKTGDAKKDDIRSMEMLRSLSPDAVELPRDTALRETEEELGVTSEDLLIDTLQDQGLQDYASAGKGTYPIHFFSACVKDVSVDLLRERAREHTQDVRWATLATLQDMVREGKFKGGYLAIVEQIDHALNRQTP